MSLYRAALKVLKPHVAVMRSYASEHPMPAPPERRTWPTMTWVWRRYVGAMITAQTRSTEDFWDGLRADPRWQALQNGGPGRCPSSRSVSALLKERRVR